eukprot:COSAG01_NODE_410_length_17384_cov_20.323691_14_plen_260_part_00
MPARSRRVSTLLLLVAYQAPAPGAAVDLITCSRNSDCATSGFSATLGDPLTAPGLPGANSYTAGQNASSTYCAQLNGTAPAGRFCMPCKFTVTEAGRAATVEQNCYTVHGIFSPVEPCDPTKGCGSIREHGCSVCDTVIAQEQQSAVAGARCFGHDDCRNVETDTDRFYCDKVATSDDCDKDDPLQAAIYSANGICDEPFTCPIGTDNTDCQTLPVSDSRRTANMCMQCSNDNGWSTVQCHAVVPKCAPSPSPFEVVGD